MAARDEAIEAGISAIDGGRFNETIASKSRREKALEA